MTIPQALQIAVQHHQAGHLANAEALYRQILAAQPNHADALLYLGVIAQQSGRHDVAVEWIRRAIVFNPHNPVAHYNLGETFRTTGRLDEAIAAYRRALHIKPEFPGCHNSLGTALADKGQYEEAASSYRGALQLEPGYVEAHNNLGTILAEQGRAEEAAAAFRRAIELKPGYAEAHFNLGNVLERKGQIDQAIAAFERALQLRPDFAEAHNNLGGALRQRGQLNDAMAACRRALQPKPELPEAHNNLGDVLREGGQLDDAVAAFHRALELKPDYAEAHNNLGNALKERGELDEAIASYRRALQTKPDHPGIHSNLILLLHYHPGHDKGTISEEQRRWNQQFSDPVKSVAPRHANDRSPERRLRLGYVSPDFWEHVAGRYALPLIESHDREQFEILCYAGVVRPDKLTDEFRRHAGEWRGTVGVGDEALAEMIRRDGVDILVDLSQHMAGNRLPVFARKPAPVQVSFGGYPESAGMEAIENRISDRYLEGAASEEDAARKEHVWLIDSFWCYDPCGVRVEVNGLPAIESGRITFGSLNSFHKINEPVLRLWARVLNKVEDSRLILLSGVGSHRQRALETFAREGVAPHRVTFVEFRPRRDYLELYHRLDIVLDTFPYNGHTTSLDALWMGVPVVSLAGVAPVSRAGLSQLTNLGLAELAAPSEDDYVRIAVGLAGDLPRLAQLRSTLRDRMKTSVLMDSRRFAHNVEVAFRAMWRRWCAQGEEATGLEGSQ